MPFTTTIILISSIRYLPLMGLVGSPLVGTQLLCIVPFPHRDTGTAAAWDVWADFCPCLLQGRTGDIVLGHTIMLLFSVFNYRVLCCLPACLTCICRDSGLPFGQCFREILPAFAAVGGCLPLPHLCPGHACCLLSHV